MKSARSKDLLKCNSLMLYIHFFLVPLRDAFRMAQPDTDKDHGRVAVPETVNHTVAMVDLSVQPLHDVFGTNTIPMLAGKIAISRNFLDGRLHLPISHSPMCIQKMMRSGGGF